MSEPGYGSLRGLPLSRSGLVLLGFLAVAGYFLWVEHEAHVMGLIPYLPFLLLLTCPLMHLFMRHGHGGDGADQGSRHGGPPAGRGNP